MDLVVELDLEVGGLPLLVLDRVAIRFLVVLGRGGARASGSVGSCPEVGLGVTEGSEIGEKDTTHFNKEM